MLKLETLDCNLFIQRKLMTISTGSAKEGKVCRGCAILVLFCTLWLERNSGFFKEKSQESLCHYFLWTIKNHCILILYIWTVMVIYDTLYQTVIDILFYSILFSVHSIKYNLVHTFFECRVLN